MELLRSAAAVAGALTMCAAALAQKPAEIRVGSGPYTFAPVIVASTAMVPVTVVVRNRNGKVIPGLKEDRFRLTDDGRPQRLTSFEMVAAPEGDKVALLFDDVDMDRAGVLQARNAAMRLVRETLKRGVRMAVFTTSGREDLGFTRDQTALARAIAAVGAHQPVPLYGSGACTMSDYSAYQIAVLRSVDALVRERLLDSKCSAKPMASGGPGGSGPVRETVQDRDAVREMDDDANVSTAEETWHFARTISQATLAVVRAVVNRTAEQTGQRIVVLVSSGFLTETLGKEKEGIIRDALRGGVVVDALDAKGPYAEDGGPAPVEAAQLPLPGPIFAEDKGLPAHEARLDAMASFAAATGGLFFENNDDLTLGLQRMGLAPGAGYGLGFIPAAMAHDGKLHQIRVRLEPPIPGATIEARRGYYDPPPGLSEREVEQDLYEGMASRATASVVPAEVAVRAAAGELWVQVHFSVAAENERLALVAGLFAANGKFVSGERGEVDLALKSGTFKKLRKTGLAPTFALKAPAGKYRLRVVVLDEGSQAVTEINRQVRIR